MGPERDGDPIEVLHLDPLEDELRDTVVVARRQWQLVRGSPTWVWIQRSMFGLAVLAIALPVFALSPIEARLVSRFVALSVALLGLQFVVGVCGQLSLCHGVFVGTGSYTATIVVTTHHQPHLVGVAVAPFVGFAAGCLIGLLALRVRELYLGPVTLSVAVAFPMMVKRFGWLTGGSSGLPIRTTMRAPAWLSIPVQKPYLWHHLVICAVAVVAFVLARNIVGSSVGLAVRAAATNPISAAASGVRVARIRVIGFGVGAAFGSLGGALLVLDTPIVGADSYDLFRSLGYYAAVMVGGAAAMAGAVVGAALLVGVPWIAAVYEVSFGPNLIFGSLLLATTFAAPGGVSAVLKQRLDELVVISDPVPG